MDRLELAKKIDHTCIRLDATIHDIKKACNEVLTYGFRSIVINSSYVELANSILIERNRITSTIGFPYGTASIKSKVSELKEAIRLGAKEIDAVINIGYLKSGDIEYTRKEVISIVEMAKSFGDIIVKIIVELGYLNRDEIIKAVEIVREGGADYIKTSSGLTKISIDDIKFLKSIGGSLKIEAAGGIHDYSKAIDIINAGADIIGSSNSLKIISP
ncbi:MAG: deoxyribose-phosphate aldolase [Candidatus Nitrosocaldaceae archaeon]